MKSCEFVTFISVLACHFIFLIHDDVTNLKKRKLLIRNQYSSIYNNEIVKWFSNNEIKWTSLGMNMVHSADNSSETCCNFQCAFPNSQLMTRFMYPNVKLIF